MRKLKKHTLNFNRSFYAEQVSKRKKSIKQFMIPVYCLLVVGAIFGGQKLYSWYIQNEMDQLNIQVQSEEARVQKITSSEDYIQYISNITIINDIEHFTEIMNTYPQLMKTHLETAYSNLFDGISIFEFSFDQMNRQLMIRSKANNTVATADYVNNLIKSEMFADVTYSGIEFDQDQNAYFSNIRLTLKGEQ